MIIQKYTRRHLAKKELTKRKKAKQEYEELMDKIQKEGRSSGHVLSKTKSVTPHFFYISDITKSSSFNGKIFRKKSMLENFRANILKSVWTSTSMYTG